MKQMSPATAMSRMVVVAILVLLLVGCMLGSQISSVSIIAPQVEMAQDPEWPEVTWSLQVQRPQADQMRSSDRLMVRVSRSRLQPYAAAAWLDNVPDMFQTLLIQSLEDSGRLSGVGRVGGMRAPYSLVTEIRSFEAIDDGGVNLQVDLAIQASLMHQASGRVLATRSFSQRAKASGKGLDSLVETFEQAMGELFADLTGWLLSEGESSYEQLEQWRQHSRERDWRSRRH